MIFAAPAGSSLESAKSEAWCRARAKVSLGAGRWCWSSLVGCPTPRMQLPPGSVIRNCRTPYDMSFSGPTRGSPARDPPVRDLESGPEGRVQPVDVIGRDVARTERLAGLVLLHPEELQLNVAALDDRVRIGALLLEGHLEPEGGVEVDDGLEGLAREQRNRLLGHAHYTSQTLLERKVPSPCQRSVSSCSAPSVSTGGPTATRCATTWSTGARTSGPTPSPARSTTP